MEEQVNLPKTPTKNLEAYKGLLEISQQEQTLKAREGYLKAYIFSIFLPPIGFYYFFKYFFVAETSDNNRKTAVICLILTIVSLILSIWVTKLFIGQFAPENSQNSEFLKELITPENQKTLKQLMQ